MYINNLLRKRALKFTKKINILKQKTKNNKKTKQIIFRIFLHSFLFFFIVRDCTLFIGVRGWKYSTRGNNFFVKASIQGNNFFLKNIYTGQGLFWQKLKGKVCSSRTDCFWEKCTLFIGVRGWKYSIRGNNFFVKARIQGNNFFLKTYIRDKDFFDRNWRAKYVLPELIVSERNVYFIQKSRFLPLAL